MTLGEVLVKLTGDATGLKSAVDQGKRALGEIPGAAQTAVAQAGAHTSRFGTQLTAIGTAATNLGRTLLSVGAIAAGAFAAITVGAAALATRLTGPIRAMADLKDEAYALGTSAEQLSRLQAASRLVGVEVEQLRMGVGQLATKLEEARDPTSQTAITFKTLGVDIRQGVIPAMLQLVQVLAQLPNQTQALAIAREMLGRTGTRLLALGADYQNLATVADRSGQTVSNSMAEAADATADAIDIMRGAFQGFTNRAVQPLLGPLKEASERLTRFFAQDPRGIDLAQRLTRQLGAALEYVTRPETLEGIGRLAGEFGTLAASTGKAVASVAQLVPGITRVVELVGTFAGAINALPPEARGALLGAAIGGRVGAAGAVIGAVGGAAAGAASRGQTPESSTLSLAQRMTPGGAAAAFGQAIADRLSSKPAWVIESGTPASRGIMTPAEQPTQSRMPEWPTAGATTSAGHGQWLDIPRAVRAITGGGGPATGGMDRANREAERLAAFWDKAPAQISDIRDAEERLAVTRDEAIKDYEASVRKPTFTESLATDYFGTMAEALDDAEQQAGQLIGAFDDLADSLSTTAVRSSVFASALEVLFGTGPIQDRLSNVLQRRFADILDALYRSVDQQADKQQKMTGEVGSSPWTDYLKKIFGGGRKEEPTMTPATEPTMTPVPEAATAGILAKIETVGTKMMGAAAVAQAGAQVVADTITGIRELRDIVDKMSEQPGVTSSELYAVGSSRFPFIGKFLEPFNQIASSILGRNAPAPATGALAGATAGAAIGMFGGPAGAAIGAAIGAALGAVLGKLFQAPTAEAQLNRALARYAEQVGVPRVLPGDRGINLRAFGRSGGPTQPAFADIDTRQAGFAGRLFATEAGRLPEREAIPGRVQQFLINTATALRLTADEADRMFRRFEQPLLGKNLEDALLRLTSLRAQGRITASDMQAGFARAVQIFEDLPDAINTSRLALAAFDEAGRVNFQTLTRAAEDARKVIVEGMGQTFNVLIQTGSAEAAGRTLAGSFAGTFIEAVMQELQAAPLSSALTDAVVMARQAAIAFREGDRQEARRLLVDARREFLQGRQELLAFLQPIASDTRSFTQSMTGAGGFINQRIPSFDVGGLVPGAIGQPMLATVHGGEFVLRSQDTQQMVSLLQQVASAVQRGWSVIVQDRSVHTLEIDGRELARVQADTDRLHRGTGVVLPQTGLGVR